MMNHFDLSEWTDFVRGLLPGERRTVLESHLAGDCQECTATAALLRKVAATSEASGHWEVPIELSAAAEAIFSARPSLLERIVGHLVYDSRSELQLAGVRAGRPTALQVAYEAGDYYVDLSMERNATQVVLLGQLANRKSPTSLLHGQQVLLMSGNQLAGRAVTNEFGEFSIEFKPRKHLRLCFPVVNSGAQIEVSLEELQ